MSYCSLDVVLTEVRSWRVSNEAKLNRWCQEELCLHGRISRHGPGWFVSLLPSPWLDKPVYVHLGTEEDVIGLVRSFRGVFEGLGDGLTPIDFVKDYCGFAYYTPSPPSAYEAEKPVHIYLFLSAQKFASLSRLALNTYVRHHDIHAQFMLEGKALDGFTRISSGGVNCGVWFGDADVDADLTLSVKEYEFVDTGHAQPEPSP